MRDRRSEEAAEYNRAFVQKMGLVLFLIFMACVIWGLFEIRWHMEAKRDAVTTQEPFQGGNRP